MGSRGPENRRFRHFQGSLTRQVAAHVCSVRGPDVDHWLATLTPECERIRIQGVDKVLSSNALRLFVLRPLSKGDAFCFVFNYFG